MKKILSTLLVVPALSFASHSIEIGGFYSNHSEPGYRYNLGGPFTAFEIGNSKGLKAVGKVLFSSNSDLIFLHTRTEFRWYLPYANFELFPVWGAHIFHHQVIRKGEITGALNRLQTPLGMGFKHKVGGLMYEVSLNHLFPLGSTYVYNENTREFWGNKVYLPPCFYAHGKVMYETDTNFRANLGIRYAGDYYQHVRNIEVEISGTYRF